MYVDGWIINRGCLVISFIYFFIFYFSMRSFTRHFLLPVFNFCSPLSLSPSHIMSRFFVNILLCENLLSLINLLIDLYRSNQIIKFLANFRIFFIDCVSLAIIIKKCDSSSVLGVSKINFTLIINCIIS